MYMIHFQIKKKFKRPMRAVMNDKMIIRAHFLIQLLNKFIRSTNPRAVQTRTCFFIVTHPAVLSLSVQLVGARELIAALIAFEVDLNALMPGGIFAGHLQPSDESGKPFGFVAAFSLRVLFLVFRTSDFFTHC